MAAYADYDFYSNTYCGKLTQQDFNSVVQKASAYLDFATADRIAGLPVLSESIQFACCAVTDQIFADEQSYGKSAETVGSYSVSFQNKSDSQRQRNYFKTISLYLINSGLLYKGA